MSNDLTDKQLELLKQARSGLLATEAEKHHKSDIAKLREQNLVKNVQLSHPQVDFTEDAVTTTDDGERVLNNHADRYDLEKENVTLVEGGEKQKITKVKTHNPNPDSGEKAKVKETTVKPS